MRILYGINTIGQGHINRSRTIIQQLIADGHHVDCIFSGPIPPDYAKVLAHRWMHLHGYLMRFNGHQIDTAKTFYTNLRYARSIMKSLLKSFRLIRKEKYDAVFNDFDLITSITGFFLRKPVIVIDHQHSLIHPGAIRAPGKISDIFNVLVAIGMTVPYFSYIYTLDFVNQPIRRFKETLFPLIYKPELKDYPISLENHFCVYLPYIKEKKIVEVFSQFPEERFIVYGLNNNKIKGNIVFRPTSRDLFLKCMASSKGVIAHSGFSMSWEVMILHKPFYTIPLVKHYEQHTNAYRLSQLNLAYVASDLTVEDVKKFITYARTYDYNLPSNINILEPYVLTNSIYQKIGKHA